MTLHQPFVYVGMATEPTTKDQQTPKLGRFCA